MGKFTKVPKDTFDGLQLETGCFLNADPTEMSEVPDSAIICATSGGIKIDCVATFSDFGEDVDNVPANTKELAHLDEWNCSITTTVLSFKTDVIKLALGVADIDGNKVVPRRDLKQEDFTELWWAGDLANGGAAAVKIFNALSTSGISIQTAKKSKGKASITITGFASLEDQDVVPMEFYYMAPSSSTP